MSLQQSSKSYMGGSTILSIVFAAILAANLQISVAAPVSTNPVEQQLNSFASLLEKRDLSRAELEQLAKIVNDNPNSFLGHTVLARSYELAGLEDLSLGQSIAAWNLSKKDLQAFLAAQNMALKSGNEPANDELNSRSLVVFSDDFRSLNILAALSEKRGDSALARRYLQASLKAAPNDSDTRVLYLSALMADHRYHELLKEIHILESQNKDPKMKEVISSFRGIALLRLHYPHRAVKYLEEAFKSSPSNLQVCRSYFESLLNLGRYRDAVYPGMMMLALQPPFGDAPQKAKQKLRPVLAESKIGSVELQNYLAKIQQQIKDPGRFAYFNFLLADLMDEIGNYDQAQILFTNGLNIDSSFGRGYMRLAKVMEKLGRDTEVIKDLYRSALEADSKDPEIVAGYRRTIARDSVGKKDLAGRTKALIRSR